MRSVGQRSVRIAAQGLAALLILASVVELLVQGSALAVRLLGLL
jgi:hypothetical protein